MDTCMTWLICSLLSNLQLCFTLPSLILKMKGSHAHFSVYQYSLSSSQFQKPYVMDIKTEVDKPLSCFRKQIQISKTTYFILSSLSYCSSRNQKSICERLGNKKETPFCKLYYKQNRCLLKNQDRKGFPLDVLWILQTVPYSKINV